MKRFAMVVLAVMVASSVQAIEFTPVNYDLLPNGAMQVRFSVAGDVTANNPTGDVFFTRTSVIGDAQSGIWLMADDDLVVRQANGSYTFVSDMYNYLKFDPSTPGIKFPNSVYIPFGNKLYPINDPDSWKNMRSAHPGELVWLSPAQVGFVQATDIRPATEVLQLNVRGDVFVGTPTPIAASPTVTPTPTVVVNTPTPPAPDATATPTVTPTVQQTPTVDPNAIPVTWRSGRGDTVRYLNGSGQVVSENDNPVRVEVKSPLFGSEWDAGIYAGLNLQQGLEVGDTLKVTFTVTADKAAQVQVLLEENRGGTAGLYRLTNYDPATNAPPAVSVSAGTSRHTVTLTVREKNTKAVQLTFWVGHNPSTTVSIDMTTLEVLRQ